MSYVRYTHYIHINTKLFQLMVVFAIYIQAVLRGLTRPQYVWIMYGWYQDVWWKEGTDECSEQELANAIEGALTLQLFPRPTHSDTLSDVGLVRSPHISHTHTSHTYVRAISYVHS